MKSRKRIVLGLLLAGTLSSGGNISAQNYPFQDESLSRHERVMDIINRLTIEEKSSLMQATSHGVPRLGIPKYYYGNEALHGIIRPGRFTVFPQAIALSATWNPDLIYNVSTAISDEARGRWNELEHGKKQTAQFSDLLTFWSPTVNMARDPRWGRTPETYGEDPFLSGKIGTAFVRGLQGNDPNYLKVVSTPKHFAVNNEEHNRFECDARVSERDLREYYLAPFEACITEGKAASIMSSYNAINGVPATANPWLLTKVLRQDWGFDGYVVSDCGAPGLLLWSHKYVKTKETSATLCLKAGLDIECGDDVFGTPLQQAYKQYMVSDADVDTAVYRLLYTRMRLGLFDAPESCPYSQISPDIVGCKKHVDLALEASRQSIVLLKNDNILPFNTRKVRSIAVVGINADKCEYGDYSGVPVGTPVSVLQGIRDKVGDKVKVMHAPWKSAADGLELISEEYFPEGLTAQYFTNMNLEGEAKERQEPWVNYEPSNQPPDPFIPQGSMSVRWKGKLRPTVSGKYQFCFTAAGGGERLRINGQTVIDQWWNHPVQQDKVEVELEAGRDYDFEAEYFYLRDFSMARLQWSVPQVEKSTRLELYGDAGRIAKECDMVVAVMGINKTIEREGQDRHSIELPADQQEFLREIYKVNPNVVLVLVAGSSLAINWEDEHLPAIVNAWYPGEQGGTAVADVLFGDYNPSGRLPLTYYTSLEELPPFGDYELSKGRTYQYFKGEVLYPFGYGLSYTQFKYSDLKLSDNGGSIAVSFTLRNSGCRAGDEVAQVYVQLPEEEGITNAIKQLKGFERVSLKKGKRQQVIINIPKAQLRRWSEKEGKFYTPAGTYKFMIGASSADIRLNGELSL
ncbi:MAG: glycoside hydrolase family 3 C-terminal domain-containing protein [Coprobacter sp.]|nr:glycoside hydrolase family 3 C-terminal domain-containing protein [Coprobacter sp.]